MLTFKSLEDIDIKEIVSTLNEAFADYSLSMPYSVDFWINHWKRNRVKYELSFGVFDEDRLIGFIINGIDYRNGNLMAYNAGTGVIPKCRGQKLVQQLYQFAFPILQQQNIRHFSLEVMSQNIKAIKAYQSVGFKINTLYQCFQLKQASIPLQISYKVQQTDKANWALYKSIEQENYSWENVKAGIEATPDTFEYFDFFDNSKNLIAYYIFNPVSQTVDRFDAKHKKGYDALFHHWQKQSNYLRILNVHHQEKVNFLNLYGFENYLNQFEMILSK